MENRIIADLKNSYGLTYNQITPVTGGLLNKKWKVSTDKGELLIKQYSTKRFDRKNLKLIESRLQRQIFLQKKGFSCPLIWQSGGQVIRWLNEETVYMVMEFCKGDIKNSDSISINQMYSLGGTCALMHRALSQLPQPLVKSLPHFGGYTLDSLWEKFRSRLNKCSSEDHSGYRQTLLALEPILKRLSPEFFDKFSKGYAHEDFHSGNILFNIDCVSAVVDFDRNCWSYILHDIGRAILSFALEEDKMNIEKIYAFQKGYSQYLAITLSDIANALRLSWCIEIVWWIQPEFFEECDKTPKRFRDEMLWLTKHWFEMDSILYSY
ncbi:phosphotransferase [Sporomusa termitida]|uniref:Homoserine kinase n=1 Tax=Sporomusa termitida TaxID=2377 RepID=A0A517DQC5_9FIRM|nr:phosphotransferase [Sporomusa termitida]QDR79563.1 Homoserine kinase [Sporomusa termitida]